MKSVKLFLWLSLPVLGWSCSNDVTDVERPVTGTEYVKVELGVTAHPTDGSKTTISGTVQSWESDDTISVIHGEGVSSNGVKQTLTINEESLSVDGKSATFEGEMVASATPAYLYTIYPATDSVDAKVSIDGEDVVVSTPISGAGSQVQNFLEDGSIDPASLGDYNMLVGRTAEMCVVPFESDCSVDMVNVMTILKFDLDLASLSLSDDAVLKSLTVKSSSAEFATQINTTYSDDSSVAIAVDDSNKIDTQVVELTNAQFGKVKGNDSVVEVRLAIGAYTITAGSEWVISLDVQSGDDTTTYSVTKSFATNATVVAGDLQPVTIPNTWTDGSASIVVETIAMVVTNGDTLSVDWDEPITNIAMVDSYEVEFFADDLDATAASTTHDVVKSESKFDIATTSSSIDALDDGGVNKTIYARVVARNAAAEVVAQSAKVAYSPYFNNVAEGDVDAPHEIANGRHLINVNRDLNGYYTQTKDIDMTDIAFTPIAGIGGEGISKTRPEFTGTYLGNDWKISNLTISETSKGNMTTVGLFGKVCGATIERVILENVDVSVESGNYDNYVGAIAGYVEFKGVTGDGAGVPTKIRYCKTTGSSSVKLNVTAWVASNDVRTSAYSCVGGIVGLIDTYNTTIDSSALAANADGEAPANSSGGTTAHMIEKCSNSATVVGFTTAGGVVGSVGYPNANIQFNLFATIKRCNNVGSVGIDMSSVAISNPQGQGVGGIVGKVMMWSIVYVNNMITECWNSGDVCGVGKEGSNDRNVPTGGIVGRAVTYGVQNCYNTGKVTFTGSTNKSDVSGGGIVGYSGSVTTQDKTILNCFSIGEVEVTMPAASSSSFGTIVGYLTAIYPSIIDCGAYAVDGYDAVGVKDGVTPTEVTTFEIVAGEEAFRETYPEDWDFTSVWVMGAEHPELIENK